MVDTLLTSARPINALAQDKEHGQTALHLASRNGHTSVVKAFLLSSAEGGITDGLLSIKDKKVPLSSSLPFIVSKLIHSFSGL